MNRRRWLVWAAGALGMGSYGIWAWAQQAPRGSKKSRGPVQVGDEILGQDVTAQMQRYNSDTYSAPPSKFRPGTARPHQLSQDAVRRLKDGYVVQFPSKAPIPTPAVYQGKIYTGGGFRSREFYCLDARTGNVVWACAVSDDGPSSPAVDEGVVVYNTESCTLFAHDASTGRLLWSWWLGDPLMSAPTIARGRVFTVFPAGGGAFPAGGAPAQALPQALQQIAGPVPQLPQPKARRKGKKAKGKQPPPLSHALACFELKTGKLLWCRWIDGDAISSPVAAGRELYVATVGGTVYRFRQSDGAILEARRARATSAPVVLAPGKLLFTRRTDNPKNPQVEEGLAVQLGPAKARVDLRRRALQLDARVQALGNWQAMADQLDAANGFAAGAPAAVGAMAAQENIGQWNVSSIQLFQGSRILNWGRRNYACLGGDLLVCTDLESGRIHWQQKLPGDMRKLGGSLAAPPAGAAGKLYVSLTKGELWELDARSGKILRRFKIGGALRFQPLLAQGSIFVTNAQGQLRVVQLNDPRLAGWTHWGRNAARSGRLPN